MSDAALKAKQAELQQLQEKATKLRAAEENAATEYTEARELLDGMRQSNANDQDLRAADKNNPQAMKGFEEFDKMLSNIVKLEKDRRLAAEKIADELGETKRDILKVEEEITKLKAQMEQQKASVEVAGMKDGLDIDFDALEKQSESTDDLLQSTAKTTQAHLESSVAQQTSTMARVQKDIDLCNNLQSKLQTERAALSSGVINRVMNWRKISEIDKHLNEVTAKKTDRESMLKEVNSELEKATKELEAHKKTFGVKDGAKVNNVGTNAHINFHGHGDKQDQAQQVTLANTSPGSHELTKLLPKGHAPR